MYPFVHVPIKGFFLRDRLSIRGPPCWTQTWSFSASSAIVEYKLFLRRFNSGPCGYHMCGMVAIFGHASSQTEYTIFLTRVSIISDLDRCHSKVVCQRTTRADGAVRPSAVCCEDSAVVGTTAGCMYCVTLFFSIAEAPKNVPGMVCSCHYWLVKIFSKYSHTILNFQKTEGDERANRSESRQRPACCCGSSQAVLPILELAAQILYQRTSPYSHCTHWKISVCSRNINKQRHQFAALLALFTGRHLASQSFAFGVH